MCIPTYKLLQPRSRAIEQADLRMRFIHSYPCHFFPSNFFSRANFSPLSLSLSSDSLTLILLRSAFAREPPLCSVVVYVSLLRFLPRIAESFVSVALCVFLVVSSFSLSLLALLALESPLPATAARLQWQCERRARVVALFVYLARICPRARGREGNWNFGGVTSRRLCIHAVVVAAAQQQRWW